jgi:hypothetical protein
MGPATTKAGEVWWCILVLELELAARCIARCQHIPRFSKLPIRLVVKRARLGVGNMGLEQRQLDAPSSSGL